MRGVLVTDRDGPLSWHSNRWGAGHDLPSSPRTDRSAVPPSGVHVHAQHELIRSAANPDTTANITLPELARLERINRFLDIIHELVNIELICGPKPVSHVHVSSLKNSFRSCIDQEAGSARMSTLSSKSFICISDMNSEDHD